MTHPLVPAPDGSLTTPALADALWRIDRLARHSRHLTIKSGARDALRLGDEWGADDRELRARYGVRVRALAARGLTLEQATDVVQRIRDDVRGFTRTHPLTRRALPTLPVRILSEMALIARWLRRHEPFRWPEIIEAMGGAQHALPAPVRIEAAE